MFECIRILYICSVLFCVLKFLQHAISNLRSWMGLTALERALEVRRIRGVSKCSLQYNPSEQYGKSVKKLDVYFIGQKILCFKSQHYIFFIFVPATNLDIYWGARSFYKVIQKERMFFERLVLGVGCSDCGGVWRV